MPAEVAPAWDRFLSMDADRPAGLDIYPDIFADGWLFPLQRQKETEAMIRLARTITPKVVFEIGSDKGGGLYHWVKGLPSAELVIAAEIRGCPFKESFARSFPDRKFLFLEGSSYHPDAVNQVRRFLNGRKIDCLFIDGDKLAFDLDFDLYRSYMARGGIVFLHDIQDADNPAQTFKTLSKEYRTEQIIDTSEYDLIEARERAGIPVASGYEGWFRVWKRSSCGVGVVHI